MLAIVHQLPTSSTKLAYTHLLPVAVRGLSLGASEKKTLCTARNGRRNRHWGLSVPSPPLAPRKLKRVIAILEPVIQWQVGDLITWRPAAELARLPMGSQHLH